MILSPIARMARIAALQDREIPLAEACLLIGALDHPGLVLDASLDQLDALAAASGLGERSARRGPPRAESLAHFLFVERGYAGNRQDYYDPRNSFLDQVVTRKLGIPITLAVLFLEVARRLGIRAQGIGFPGHFLVSYRRGGETAVLDPFAQGATLTSHELDRRLRRLFGQGGPTVANTPELLRPATRREIVVRLLRNLKGIYLNLGDHRRALEVLDLVLLFAPDAGLELRARAAVHQQLGMARAALADLQRYLEVVPEAPDADTVRASIDHLRSSAGRLH